jgi:glycosyltransferase involved in cell wall biosynthesis
MKKVVFFVEPDWAFGTVHYEMFKYLWVEGFNCQLLPWNKPYTIQELVELDNHIDFWVTTHHGFRFLGHVYGAIRPERCVVIAHAPLDINELINYHGTDDFYKFKAYGVVSDYLKQHSINHGITRIPYVCPVALNYNTFYNKPSSELRTVGFAGAYHDRDEITQDMIDDFLAKPRYKKRGYLVKECAEKAGLEFKIASNYHNNFVTMSGFYNSVDCVIIASTEEGAGLPALEAGAAGKLVIGTPVGHWERSIGHKGGIEVPILEIEFVEKTVEILTYYKNNPHEYHNRCLQIQEHARTYDWSYVISHWINLFQQ